MHAEDLLWLSDSAGLPAWSQLRWRTLSNNDMLGSGAPDTDLSHASFLTALPENSHAKAEMALDALGTGGPARGQSSGGMHCPLIYALAGSCQWFKGLHALLLQCMGHMCAAVYRTTSFALLLQLRNCQIFIAAAVYGTYVVASFTPAVCFEAHHSVAAIKIVVGCSWGIVLLNW